MNEHRNLHEPANTDRPQAVGSFFGEHVLAEFRHASELLLSDELKLRSELKGALERGQASVLDMISVEFTPSGVTVIALLEESHASLHTYPRHRAAFVDIFTCGTKSLPEEIMRHLAAALNATICNLQRIARGDA